MPTANRKSTYYPPPNDFAYTRMVSNPPPHAVSVTDKGVKVRFNLRSLLVLMTATGLFLGYFQIRSSWINREVAELTELGVRFSPQADWFESPYSASIPCIGNPRFDELFERVHNLGIKYDNIRAVEF